MIMYKLGKAIGTALMMFLFSTLTGVTLSAISFWYFRNSIDDKKSAIIGLANGSICHFILTIMFAKMLWQL